VRCCYKTHLAQAGNLNTEADEQRHCCPSHLANAPKRRPHRIRAEAATLYYHAEEDTHGGTSGFSGQRGALLTTGRAALISASDGFQTAAASAIASIIDTQAANAQARMGVRQRHCCSNCSCFGP